jgi:hypothetical protein
MRDAIGEANLFISAKPICLSRPTTSTYRLLDRTVGAGFKPVPTHAIDKNTGAINRAPTAVKTFMPVSNVGAENFQPLQSYRGITIKHKNLWDGNEKDLKEFDTPAADILY